MNDINFYKFVTGNSSLHKKILASVFFCIFILLFFVSFGFNIAFASDNGYDDNSKPIEEKVQIYNDGTLKVTSKITAGVSQDLEDVIVKDKVIFENLSESENICLDKTVIELNEGFQGANISGWKIYNNNEIIFDGDASTQFVPDVIIEKRQSKEFNVTTSLKCEDAMELVYTEPFKFTYHYHEDVNDIFKLTLDANGGTIGDSSLAKKEFYAKNNTSCLYTTPACDVQASFEASSKQGCEFSGYFTEKVFGEMVLLNDGNFASFVDNYTDGSVWALTEDTTLYAHYENNDNYHYAVTIGGINQDGENTITFGPATGDETKCLDVNGNHEHCIHNETWDEIIVNIKNGHAEGYRDCLNKACTKDVSLSNNKTIMNYPTSFTRSSCLYDYIKGNGRLYDEASLSYTCFNNYCHKIGDPEIANGSSSGMRATFNGCDNDWQPFELSEYAIKDSRGNVYNPCTKDNCLLSSFPDSLKKAIVPKEYRVPTNGSENTILSSVLVKDKLGIPSCQEIYGPLPDDLMRKVYLNDYGQRYEKMVKLNLDGYPGMYGIEPLNTIKEKDTSWLYGNIAYGRLRTSIKLDYMTKDPGVVIMKPEELAYLFIDINPEDDVGNGESGLCPCFVLGGGE